MLREEMAQLVGGRSWPCFFNSGGCLPRRSAMLWPTICKRGISRSMVIRSQASVASSNDGNRRHVIVTGGNSGIGKTTCLDLAKQGFSVTIACRNKERGREAADEIRRLSGNPLVKAMTCDLASFTSIRSFANEYKESNYPLHVLVNNAGIMACPQSYTKDGFEMQFGVNHLGHFLLTALLLDKLATSASPKMLSRVVVVASAAERIGSLDLDDLSFRSTRSYNRWVAYGQSKLANCLFSLELSRRCKMAGLQVTSNCLHPGIVDTQLFRYFLPQALTEKAVLPELRSFLLKLFGLRTPEDGASTSVYLASSKEVEGVSGLYYEDCQVKTPSLKARDETLAESLWEVSECLTETSECLRQSGLMNLALR